MQKPVRRYTITQLCSEFGVTPRSLRHWEQFNILSPHREGVGMRIYERGDRARLKLALQGQAIGLTLKEIGELLNLYDPGGDNAEQKKLALRLFGRQLGVLRKRRTDLDDAIAALESACAALEAPAKAGELAA